MKKKTCDKDKKCCGCMKSPLLWLGIIVVVTVVVSLI